MNTGQNFYQVKANQGNSTQPIDQTGDSLHKRYIHDGQENCRQHIARFDLRLGHAINHALGDEDGIIPVQASLHSAGDGHGPTQYSTEAVKSPR